MPSSFSILHSQFSILNSQFSILNSLFPLSFGMAHQSHSWSDRLLTVEGVRRLTRKGRTAAVPEALGERIRHVPPQVMERDAESLHDIFRRLIERAEKEILDAGIVPEIPIGVTERLTTAEKTRVSTLAALYAWQAAIQQKCGVPAEGLSCAEKGTAWAARVEDDRQGSICLLVAADLHGHLHRPDEAIESLERGLDLARRGGTPTDQVRVNAALAYHLGATGRTEESEKRIEEGLALLEHEVEEGDCARLRALLLSVRAENRLHHGDHVAALELWRRVLRTTTEGEMPDIHADLHYRISRLLFTFEDDEGSIVELREAARLYEQIGEQTQLGYIWCGLATIHLRGGDVEGAIETIDRVVSCIRNEDSPLGMEYLVKKGSILNWKKDFAEAEPFLTQALEIAQGAENREYIFGALHQLADIAMRQEQFDVAESRYTEMLDRFELPAYDRMRMRIFRSMALIEQGRLDEAASELDDVEEEAKAYPMDYVHLLHFRSRIAERRGDPAEALQIERKAIRMERESAGRRSATSFRAARILAELDALETELDLERSRRQRIEKELVAKTVELGDNRQAISAASEILQKLVASSRSPGGISREAVGELRSALRTLDDAAPAHPVPIALFHGTDDEFFERLRRTWPGLTTRQERLCGLIRAGLSNREIEGILDLRSEGLKALRKRLRKAMNLTPGDNLDTLIRQL